MSGDIKRGGLASWIMTASAVGQGLLGLVLLFAGREIGPSIFGRDLEPLISLWAAALIGFGSMNWIARRSILGGIYGRPLVVGTQFHYVVGAITLLKQGAAAGGPPAYWALVTFYAAGALGITWLLMSPGAKRD